jgi:hypothetical protein
MSIMKPTIAATTLLMAAGAWSVRAAEDPERKAAMARIDKEIEDQKKGAEAATAKLMPEMTALKAKVAQKEKTLRDLTRRKRNTVQAQKALDMLLSDVQEFQEQIDDQQRPFLQRQDELEQERRRVMVKHPEVGDPTFLEVEKKLFTEDEWAREKKKYPALLAEEYIQELLKKGVIRSAKYTHTNRQAIPMDVVGTGITAKDFVNVHYTVQYVSKAGLVNERDTWVTVLTLDGTTWAVSIRMKQLEVLGGLP